MLVKKELVVNGKKAVLSYNNVIFNKDADQLVFEKLVEDFNTNAEILFVDYEIKTCLSIGTEEYYNEDELKEMNGFYFEVVDRDNLNNELCWSDSIYEPISNEKELINLFAEESHFINNMSDFKRCPKGYVAGYCDEEASLNCEYSALKVEGLCGAECLNCNGDIHAYKEDEAYICGCNKILFKDRNFDKR